MYSLFIVISFIKNKKYHKLFISGSIKHSLKLIMLGCLIEAIILTSFNAFYFSYSVKLSNFTFFNA